MGNEAAALADPAVWPDELTRDRLSAAPDQPRPAEGSGQMSESPRHDRPDFESFFQAEYPRLLRALYLVCGSRYEAEELAQDAFVRAYERWTLVLRADNQAGYVYRIAINLYRASFGGRRGQRGESWSASPSRTRSRRWPIATPSDERSLPCPPGSGRP